MQGRREKITLANGEEYGSIKEACLALGLNYRTVMARRKRGESIESQFMTDVLCNRCKVEINKKNKYRDERLCNDCGKIVKAEREKRHSEKRRSTERAWRIRNKEKVRSYRLKEKESGSHYKRKYGITKEQADEILSSGCECCGSMQKLVIDHCHKTGVVRGCLCHGCNVALGFAKENPKALLELSKYAEKWKVMK